MPDQKKMRRHERLAQVLTKDELAYLSRAIFRQRTDKSDDEPKLASQLDPLISLARDVHVEGENDATAR